MDDQIWSNTRFRICLKVADKSDSTGMVGVPAAAGITTPGRGYVQVGYNEVFELVQTAYTGADYIPADRFINKEQQRVSLIDGCGQIASSSEVKAVLLENGKKQSQLEAVVNYLAKISVDNDIKPNLIWQEPLKKVISLGEISLYNQMKIEKEEYIITPVAGVIDDPEIQKVHPLAIDLNGTGHVVLYGMPGSGKTTFLQTLIYSTVTTYTQEDICFNILDFGGRVLELFSLVPHVANVLFPDDLDRIEQLFTDLCDEIDVRRSLFARVRQENLPSYRRAAGEKLPAIVLIIDNFSKFYEQCSEYEEKIGAIVKEGAKYGITIVATANTVNAISYKFTDYFVLKYTLQFPDASDYTAIMVSTMGMKPEAVKGRGLMRYDSRLVEYHTALAFDETDYGLRSTLIISEIERLYGRKVTGNINGKARQNSYENDAENINEKVAAASEVKTLKEKNDKDKPKEKRPGFSMPGLGFVSKPSSPSPKAAKNKAGDELKTYFRGTSISPIIARNRKTGAEYAISLDGHPAFYLMHDETYKDNKFLANIACDIARNKLGEVVYFGQQTFDQGEGVSTYNDEAGLAKLIDRISSNSSERLYVLIDGLMEFYRVVSDNDLQRLEKMLDSLREKNVFIIADTLLKDAEVLKDYPLGIFLFKDCPRGILVGGKAIDANSVLPGSLINKLSYDALNYATNTNAALLFDENGESARVTPAFI